MEKNKGGRPRKEINQDQFEKLCGIQCTLEEIANIMDCSSDTVERWCKRTYDLGFADAYKKYSSDGKASLRRIQFRLAEKSAAMAIWLGKQYLGQRDRDIADAMDRSNGVLESLMALHNGNNVE
jgi:transposase